MYSTLWFLGNVFEMMWLTTAALEELELEPNLEQDHKTNNNHIDDNIIAIGNDCSRDIEPISFWMGLFLNLVRARQDMVASPNSFLA